MRRRALRILTVASLTATAFAAVPAVDGHAQAAVRKTTLTLKVNGCDGCVVQPVRATFGTTTEVPVWRGKMKKVRNGSVHWTVATRRTVGMSFDINDPKAVNVGAIPDIVVAYRGIAVGDRVPAGVAKHKKRATGCWAGTHKTSITLRVRVEQFPATSAFPPPVQGFSIRPFFIKTSGPLPAVHEDLPRPDRESRRLLLSTVNGGTMRARRVLVSSVVAVTIGGMILPPAAARARVGPRHTSAPRSVSTSGVLNGVAATSGHDVWAVGSTRASQPLVLHRGRAAWSTVPVADPVTGSLNAVAATSANNAWAVGTSGMFPDLTALVLHWDGKSWTPQDAPVGGELRSVAALSDHMAWAVGSTANGRDLVLQWNGTTWQRLSVRFPGALLGVAARSAHDAWAVGIGRRLGAQVLHWNGHTWKRLTVRVPHTGGLEKILVGVAAAPHGRAWAVGDVSCGCGPGPSVVLQWDRKHWRRLHSPSPNGGAVLLGVTTVGARTAWAVGESGGGDGPKHTIILRSRGHGWKQVPAPSPGASPSLQSVVATSPRSAWAVGQTGCRTNHCHILIEHWNGRHWR